MFALSNVGNCLTILLLAISLAACGGGGGGGGGTNNPPTAADGRDEEQLEIAAATALYGISLSEGIIQLGQFGAKNLINFQLRQTSVISPSFLVCSQGSVNVTLGDSDNNDLLSAGDLFLVQASDCNSDILNAVVTGDIRIQVLDFQIDASGELSMEAIVRYLPGFQAQNEDGAIVQIEGVLRLDYSLGEIEEMLISDVSGSNLSLQILDEVETLNSFTATKQTSVNPGTGSTVNLTIDIDVDSSALDARVDCASDDVRFGVGSLNMRDSTFACSGNYGQVELRNSGDIYIALRGEQELIRTYFFQPRDVLDGGISSVALSSMDDLAFEFATRALFVDVNSMAVDMARNRALLAISSDSSIVPSSIASYTAANGVEKLIELPFNPGKIVLSNDGSALYVVEPSRGLRKYSLTDFTLLQNITAPGGILDFALSPTDDSVLAIFNGSSFRSDGEVNLYRDGDRTDTLDEISYGSRPPSLLFSPDGNRLMLEAGQFFLFDVVTDDLSLAGQYSYDGVGGEGGYIIGDTLYYGARAFAVDTLHQTGDFSASARTSYIDQNSGLAFMAGSELSICDASTYICFDKIIREDIGSNNQDFYDAILSGLEGELLVALEGQLNIYNIADLGTLGTAECNGESVTSETVNFVSFDCNIEEALYDPVRDKIYAVTNGRRTQPLSQSQILVIDPGTSSINRIGIPSTPELFEISSDSNTVYLHDKQTEVILRYDVNDWTALDSLALVPEISGGIYSNIFNVAGLVASSVDPDMILTERDSSLIAGSLVGFNGSDLITTTESVTLRHVWADPSGMFYRHDYSVYGAMQVVMNELSAVGETTSITSCPILGPLSSGFALSMCGETIDLGNGSVSSRFDFSSRNIGPVQEFMTLDLASNIAYVVINDYPDISAMVISAFDIETRTELRSLTMDYPGVMGNVDLKAVTSSGYLVALGSNGQLLILPESELE